MFVNTLEKSFMSSNMFELADIISHSFIKLIMEYTYHYILPSVVRVDKTR